MSSTAANLMKHAGRRNSMPDLNPGMATSDPSAGNNTNKTIPPRAKAYSFDDTTVPPQEPSAPSVSTSGPVVLQGRIAPSVAASDIVNHPKLDHGIPSGASTIPQSIKLSAPPLGCRSVSNVTSPSATQNADLNMLYPDFLRKRAVPEKHLVVPLEVDHSLLMEVDKERVGTDASNGDIGALLKLKSEKLGEKEETWDKLTELSLFALSGFGFFETKLGTGTYNREKKACILRQGQTDKDWMWENGLRVPISNRIAQGALR